MDESSTATTLRYIPAQFGYLSNQATNSSVHDAVESAMEMLSDVAKVQETQRVVEEKSGNEDKQDQYKQKVQQTDKQFKQLMDLSLESSALQTAGGQQYATMEQTVRQIGNDELTPSNYEQFLVPKPHLGLEQNYQAAKAQLKEKPQTQRFANTTANHRYEVFRKAIHTASGSTRSMPSIETFYDDYVADDEMEVEEERVSYKCPLSNALFENPVTNVCGHTYSRQAVTDYLRRKARYGETANCPIFGCNGVISERTLQPDAAMARAVEEYKAQLQQQRTQAASNLEQL